MRPITSIVLHHSLTKDNVLLEDTNAIRRYHVETNKWYDIGYHLVIERVGDTINSVIGRPWPMSGAHAPNKNLDSLGVCIVGNFEIAPPDSQLWAYSSRTVRWLMDIFSIDREDVFGHREVTPHRTCPGKYFNLDAFRALL